MSPRNSTALLEDRGYEKAGLMALGFNDDEVAEMISTQDETNTLDGVNDTDENEVNENE